MTKQEHTFKGYASTYKVEILNSFNPELQLKDTELAIKSKLKGFKFVATLVLVFKKIESKDKTRYGNFFFKRKGRYNYERDIDDVFKSINTTIVKKHTKIFRKMFRLDY